MNCPYSFSPVDVIALKIGEADKNALRSWSVDPDAFFAQAWCEVLGTKRE
jgi:hypothetical protein